MKHLILAVGTVKKNFVEKGENAGNQHFLLFQQCFLPFSENVFRRLFPNGIKTRNLVITSLHGFSEILVIATHTAVPSTRGPAYLSC